MDNLLAIILFEELLIATYLINIIDDRVGYKSDDGMELIALQIDSDNDKSTSLSANKRNRI